MTGSNLVDIPMQSPHTSMSLAISGTPSLSRLKLSYDKLGKNKHLTNETKTDEDSIDGWLDVFPFKKLFQNSDIKKTLNLRYENSNQLNQ